MPKGKRARRKTRVVTIATGQRVPLKEYLKGIRYAKAHPDTEFKSGLTCWWPCTGREIMEQFLESVHDKINQAVPYAQRGLQN